MNSSLGKARHRGLADLRRLPSPPGGWRSRPGSLARSRSTSGSRRYANSRSRRPTMDCSRRSWRRGLPELRAFGRTGSGRATGSRFDAEVTALGRLRHPNIVQIVDHGEKDGKPYLVMEYCESGDLTLTDLSPFSLRERLELFRQVCLGVAAAHVHNQLRPGRGALLRRPFRLQPNDRLSAQKPGLRPLDLGPRDVRQL